MCINDVNELRVGGTYILVLNVAEPTLIKVGSLGLVKLDAGYYAYVGSARGGLRGRVGRHIRVSRSKVGKLRWHIDYLLISSSVKLHYVIYVANAYIEHVVAEALSVNQLIKVAVKGFGSTDCNCVTHLFRINEPDSVKPILSVIRELGYEPCVIPLSN